MIPVIGGTVLSFKAVVAPVVRVGNDILFRERSNVEQISLHALEVKVDCSKICQKHIVREEEIILRRTRHRQNLSVDVVSVRSNESARPNRRTVQPAIPGDEMRFFLCFLNNVGIILRHFLPPNAGEKARSLLHFITGTTANNLHNNQGVIRRNFVSIDKCCDRLSGGRCRN